MLEAPGESRRRKKIAALGGGAALAVGSMAVPDSLGDFSVHGLVGEGQFGKVCCPAF